MENSSSKIQVMMKPVLLKAGIPLAITLAGCVFAKIASRKPSAPEASSRKPESGTSYDQETESCEMCNDEVSFHSLESESLPCVEADDRTRTEAYFEGNSAESESLLKQDYILGLRRQIEEMQDRELRLEKRFLYYQDLKDQEVVLMEVQNKLSLEINRAQFLERETLLLEAESKRFENVFVEYLKVLGFLEFSKSENEKLRMKFKKLLRRSKQQYHVLRKQRLQIEFHEKEISKHQKELKAKDSCIKTMEDEIGDLKMVTRILQDEKDELSNKLKAAQESAKTKEEGAMVTLEKYDELALDVERKQKDEAAQVRELIYLRWCNACLKHELMRRKKDEQEHEKTGETNEVEINFGGIEEIQGFGSDNELNQCARVGAHSRRRKLLSKFKRWVEGSEKTKHGNLDDTGEHHGNKCLRRQNSFSYGGEETCFLSTKSCSSA